MSFKIIADSTCDLPLDYMYSHDIEILPLKVIFGTEEFEDKFEITEEEFFAKLEKSSNLPTTVQIPPSSFEESFKKNLKDDKDILVITISSKLSGTYQSAVIAKEMVGAENIYIVDSGSVTLAEGALTLRAIKYRDDGLSAKETYEKLEKEKDKIKILAVVDTLKYLQKGGRMNAATAAIGGILNVKPLLEIKDGVIESIGKARGQKAAFDELMKLIMAEEIDTEKPVVIGHTNCAQKADELSLELNKNAGIKTDLTCSIGSVIATHAGPGCYGIGIFTK